MLRFALAFLLAGMSYASAGSLDFVGAVSGTNVPALTLQQSTHPAINPAACEGYTLHFSVVSQSRAEGPQLVVQYFNGSTWDVSSNQTQMNGTWANGGYQDTNYSSGGIKAFEVGKPVIGASPAVGPTYNSYPAPWGFGVALNYDWDDVPGIGTDGRVDFGPNALGTMVKTVGDVAFGNGPAAHHIFGNTSIAASDLKGVRLVYTDSLGQYPTNLSGRASLWCRNTATPPPPPMTDLLPAMTNYTTSGVTVSTSSDAGGAAWKAADDSTATYWYGHATLPQWIKFDLGSAQTASGYSVTALGTNGADPKAWTFESSTTGAFAGEQTILDTKSGQLFTSLEKKTATFASTSARYFRINVTGNQNGSPPGGVAIVELELLH